MSDKIHVQLLKAYFKAFFVTAACPLCPINMKIAIHHSPVVVIKPQWRQKFQRNMVVWERGGDCDETNRVEGSSSRKHIGFDPFLYCMFNDFAIKLKLSVLLALK